jgi:hypothetical protein
MAFNPFHAFRKHQKVFFAALTIICMFTFVLSSGIAGRGDFFYEMAMLVGMRQRSTGLASLYGKDVEQVELRLLAEQRRVANQFMRAAIFRGNQAVIDDVLGQRSQLDQGMKARVTNIIQNWQIYLNQGLASFGLSQVIAMQEEAKDKPAVAAALSELVAVLQHDVLEVERQRDGLDQGGLYFGGSLSPQGLLDFMIWKHEADRLGIQLSAGDVRDEVIREAFGKLNQNDIGTLERQLASRRSGPGIDLAKALADEFRVRFAQLAILGYDPGTASRVPALVTPYEFWEYYRKNRTEASVRFLEVPVRHFLSRVKEKPSDEELRTFFEAHKDQEYDPAKDTPGFKLPRRISVEWISASPDSTYYKKTAEQWILSAIAQAPVNPLMVSAVNFPVYQEYSAETHPGRQLQLPPWTDKNFTLALDSYAYWQRPQSAASVLGQIAGAVTTAGAPMAQLDTKYLAAIAALTGQQASASLVKSNDLAAATAEVARSRVPLSCAFMGANPLATPMVNALTAGGLWHYANSVEQYLPFRLVQNQMLRKVEQNLAGDLVSSSLQNFRQEVENKRGQSAEEAKFIKEQAQRFGWSQGVSKEPRTIYDLAQDSGLAALKEASESGSGASDDPKGKRFANAMFSDQGGDQAKLYNPRELHGNRATFVYWRTEDLPPKSLTFAEARPKMEEAWRFQRARELAKTEADKIAKQAEQTHGDAVRSLTEASLPLDRKLVALDGISRLKKTPSINAGMSARYSVFAVPENLIEYPPADFVDKVLALNEKGDVAVVTDRPQDHFYVVVLVERHEPTLVEFHGDTARDFQGNALLSQFENERRKEYKDEVIARLREEARLRIIDLKPLEERNSPAE